MNKIDFLNSFYDKNIKKPEDMPAVVTETKEDWINYVISGEIVDNNFVYADTMSVLTDGNGSCMVNLLIINENYKDHSQNLTLRFDRDRAEICGFDNDIALWEDFEDLYDIEAEFKLTKNMEQSILKQLKESLSEQFKDEMFKDHLSKKEKIKVQEFMNMTIDYFDLEVEKLSVSEYKSFIEKYNLGDEVDMIEDDYENEMVYVLKPEVLVNLNRTKDLFKDHSRLDYKFEEIKNSLKGYVIEYFNKNNIDLGFEVEGQFNDNYGELYLNLENQEFKHEYLRRNEDSSSYEDAPLNWSWAAWLIAEESPLKDEDFIVDYQTDQLLSALDQFVHTLDESTFFYDLDKRINS